MRLLLRVLLIVLGLTLAIPTGVVALVAGTLFEPAGRELVAALATGFLDAVAREAFAEGDAAVTATVFVTAFQTVLFVVLIAPTLLVAFVGEIVRTRALVWYAGTNAVLVAAVPWLARTRLPTDTVITAGEGRLTAVLFLSGAAAGFVYWAVAGRSACKS